MIKNKIFYCLILIVSLFFLASCLPPRFYFEYDDLVRDVEKVEYIYYDCNESERVTVESDTVLYCHLEKLRVEKNLDPELYLLFFKELSNEEFYLSNISNKEPVGNGIRLVLKNGNFIILADCNEGDCGIIAEFDSEGKFIKFYASFLQSLNWCLKYFEI